MNVTHCCKSMEPQFLFVIKSACIVFQISSRQLNNFTFDFKKFFCKRIKLFWSLFRYETSNCNVGPFGLQTSPNFWQKFPSNVTKRAAFSNESRELWVASVGNKLAIIVKFGCKNVKILFRVEMMFIRFVNAVVFWMSPLSYFLNYVDILPFSMTPVWLFTVSEAVFLSAWFEDFYCVIRPVATEHSVSTVPFQFVWQSVELSDVLREE